MAVLLYQNADTALAVSFTTSEGDGPSLNLKSGVATNRLRITGMIEEGDAERLRAILIRMKRAPPRGGAGLKIVAELISGGGDVYEGLKMGYLFKEFDVATLVRAQDSCLSACALAFLGGTASHVPPDLVSDRSIEIGGQVGFHSFFINPGSANLTGATDTASGLVVGFDLARGGSSLLVRYAAAMAIDPTFVARLLGRPSDVWEYVDLDGEFVDLASCAGGLERPRISPAAIATNICNHATGEFSPVEPSQAREMTALQAKRHLLEHLQSNIESFGLKGPLVKQLAAAVAARDDRLLDAIYDDLRRGGVPLLEILGPTFEVTGYDAGAYAMQCHVSYSLADPDRYEVALQGPTGLARAFKRAPRQCGRIFLYDRNDEINPRRK